MQNKESPSLRECPFCGDIPHIEKHEFWNEMTKGFTDRTYGVICDKCHTSGCQFYSTEQEAIEAWNRRYGGKENAVD